MNQTQILKRYYKEFWIAMGAYVIVVVAAAFALKDMELSRPMQVIVALLPVIPIVFVVKAILRVARDSDELIQRIQFQAVMFSAITTGMLTFAYGFLENIGFPHFPAIWTFPIMLFLWGAAFGYFNQRYQ
ncbi:MAG: hypothetical protein HFACDABA_02827 [Anaerolineales bacterium]|nr:hypothetical protein [Anaerolineales bacterium]